ncbi:TPM domain-containing protein [Inquilinus sp. CAU 1745]|uniref:TPM domain-containing protein n=1 Tax=Inquilinus sp. CAU 1745 TaxID=3140369 RepID=UPI00325AE643
MIAARLRRLLFPVLAALFLTSAAAAQSLDLPALNGRVVDEADILPADVEASLDGQLAAEEERTTNQVVVATVPSLQGVDIETFAVELFRAWQIGQTDADNGVLLLVAPEEREVRIEVGYGLEGALTDAVSSSIIRHRILPSFRDGDLSGGVQAGASAIISALGGEYVVPATATGVTEGGSGLVTSAITVGVWAFMVFLFVVRRMIGSRRRRFYGRGWAIGTGVAGARGGFSGGGFSGGGFSGGGGSSGGGGASGGW